LGPAAKHKLQLDVGMMTVLPMDHEDDEDDGTKTPLNAGLSHHIVRMGAVSVTV